MHQADVGDVGDVGAGEGPGLALATGTIMVRRPRLRGLEERFESRLVPLFVRRSEQVVTFYTFPEGHWKHLRTTNVIEKVAA